MWWRAKPQTEAERQEEIASLEVRRDRLLAKAPEAFLIYRLVFTIAGGFMIALMSAAGIFNRQYDSAGFLVLVVVASSLIVWFLRWIWLKPPASGDRWGMSDYIGYEDDGPRDLQAKIDRLRPGHQESKKEISDQKSLL